MAKKQPVEATHTIVNTKDDIPMHFIPLNRTYPTKKEISQTEYDDYVGKVKAVVTDSKVFSTITYDPLVKGKNKKVFIDEFDMDAIKKRVIYNDEQTQAQLELTQRKEQRDSLVIAKQKKSNITSAEASSLRNDIKSTANDVEALIDLTTNHDDRIFALRQSLDEMLFVLLRVSPAAAKIFDDALKKQHHA